MQKRTLSAGLLLGNDTKQGSVYWIAQALTCRRDISLERRACLHLLRSSDRWQPGEGAWYIFSTI
jgi:hypothetical protein